MGNLNLFSREDGKKLSYKHRKLLRHYLENNFLAFCCYFFKQIDGTNFQINAHHIILADTLQAVYERRKVAGEPITRLIVNIPPGYTKTEMCVRMFSAWCLAKSPRSKFIHTSYADALALENSAAVKDIITHEAFTELWSHLLRTDSKAKNSWRNNYGGGFYASSSGGQITGFRAGRSDNGSRDDFTGAMIHDDPLKPDDAYSKTLRDKINNRFTNTFESRLMHPEVPVILIMQRLHTEDPTGFLLTGGTGNMWHHLSLPVLIKPKNQRPSYPDKYTHGIPIEYDLPTGPLWEFKHTLAEIDVLKVDPYTFASQYLQSPKPIEGAIFRPEWFEKAYYDTLPNISNVVLYADTASKKGRHNDFTVFQAWGVVYTQDSRPHIYLIDQLRGKFNVPEVIQKGREFFAKHRKRMGSNRPGATTFKIEDANSGTALVQYLRQDGIPVQEITRTTDKVSRVMNVVNEIASGRVHLPSKAIYDTDGVLVTDANFTGEYLEEFMEFSPLMTHKHDDQIDPTVDAIEDLIMNQSFNLYGNL